MSVKVNHLTVTPFGSELPAVVDVSFTLPQGESTLLLGPSGAGKSTLLLAISGVLSSLETATIQGSIEAPSSGMLLQNANEAAVGETVFRDVAFGAESAGMPIVAIQGLVDRALASVGLDQVERHRDPQWLSGGELQRACLAGLLTLQPRLLLLDEPTSMLDPESAAEVRAAVAAYLEQSGASAIIAEHLFAEWLPLVQRILVLDGEGHLIADDPVATVLGDKLEQLTDWGLWAPGAAPQKPSPQPIEPLLDAEPGSITAVVGRSGSGKTTLLNQRLQDEIKTNGAARVGWLPQNPGHSIAGNSVLESAAATVRQLYSDGEHRTEYWLRHLGLGDKLHQNPHELSGGEARRLALATALAHQPRILFLDEPTVGQDLLNWQAIVDALLQTKARGASLLIATHDPMLIALADEVIEVVPEQTALPEVEDPNGPVVSPLGMAATAIVTLVCSLFFSSLTGALVALAAEATVLALVLWRFPRLRNLQLLWPVALGVLSVGFSNWWLSTEHDLTHAALIATRVAYFGLPGLVLAGSISAAEFGDQLGQFLRLPARPVVAAMVGLHKAKRLRENWSQLVLVRQVRGVRKKGLTEFASLVLLSLIEATRGAQTTAIAMDARGFSATDSEGRKVRRSWSVPARWGRYDWAFLLGAFAISAIGLFWR